MDWAVGLGGGAWIYRRCSAYPLIKIYIDITPGIWYAVITMRIESYSIVCSLTFKRLFSM